MVLTQCVFLESLRPSPLLRHRHNRRGGAYSAIRSARLQAPHRTRRKGSIKLRFCLVCLGYRRWTSSNLCAGPCHFPETESRYIRWPPLFNDINEAFECLLIHLRQTVVRPLRHGVCIACSRKANTEVIARVEPQVERCATHCEYVCRGRSVLPPRCEEDAFSDATLLREASLLL